MKMSDGRGSSKQFTRKNFKLKDGDQTYRILPGLGDLADSNRWSVHYNVHWGYKTTDGKKRPFASPEVKNRSTKMVEVPDAAKERLESLKAKLLAAKTSGNKAVYDELNSLVGQEGLYNLDSNHHMNVIDAQGNIGILKIRHKCKVALDAQIKKLESSGVYPLSPTDGRCFVFTRTGMGNETSFAVSVLQEELEVPNVGKVRRDVSHTLSDEIIARLDAEAGKLDKLFLRPTAEQVKAIVDSTDIKTGVSSYLDTLTGKNAGTDESGSDDVSEQKVSQNATPTETVSSTSTVDTVEDSSPKPPAPAISSANAVYVGTTTAVNGIIHNNTNPANTNAPTTPTTPTARKSVTEMSNEEFMDALNKGAF